MAEHHSNSWETRTPGINAYYSLSLKRRQRCTKRGGGGSGREGARRDKNRSEQVFLETPCQQLPVFLKPLVDLFPNWPVCACLGRIDRTVALSPAGS